MCSRLPASLSPRAAAAAPVLRCRSVRELSLQERLSLYSQVAPYGKDPETVNRFWLYVVHGPDRLLSFTAEMKELLHSLTDAEISLDSVEATEASHRLVRSFALRSEPCPDMYVCGSVC